MALSLLFQQDEVPTAMIIDGAKETILGEFNRKLKMSFKTDGAIHPMVECNQMRDKGTEEGSGRKIIKSGAPKRFWDDCLELESYIRSNTAHSIFKLDRLVPKIIMSGKMSNISQFCEFEWFEC